MELIADKVKWNESRNMDDNKDGTYIKDLITGETKYFRDRLHLIWGDRATWKAKENFGRHSFLYIKNLLNNSDQPVDRPSIDSEIWFDQEREDLTDNLVVWDEDDYRNLSTPFKLHIKNLDNGFIKTLVTYSGKQGIRSDTSLYKLASDEFLLTWAVEKPNYGPDIYLMRLTPDYSNSFKLSEQSYVRQDDVFSYKIHVENSGIVEDDNMIVNDILPDGVTFISSNYEPRINGQELTFSLGKMGPDQSKDIDVVVTPTYAEPGTVLANKAVIDPTKPYRKELVTDAPTVLEPSVAIGSFEPQEDEAGVGPDEQLFVFFNGDVNPLTINDSTFYLQDSSGNKVAATQNYDEEDQSASLTPSAPLAYGTKYSAYVKDVYDTDGNPVEQETWSFTTKDQEASASSAAASVASTSSVNNKNILIVPGLGGSYLWGREKNALASTISWFSNTEIVDPWDSWMSRLYLDKSGVKDSYTGIMGPIRNGSREVITDLVFGTDYWKNYEEELKYYDTNAKLDWFHYDWRKPLSTTAKRLNNKISELSKTGKVVIVAHSLGGLAVKAYMLDSKYSANAASQVSKVITLGTPFKGAPLAFAAIRYPKGYDLGTKGALNTRRVQSLAKNMSTAYVLAPGKRFFDALLKDSYFYRSSAKPLSGQNNKQLSGWLTYDQTVSMLAKNYNSQLATNAKKWRAAADYKSLPVPLYNFAGYYSDGLGKTYPDTFTYMTEYWDSVDGEIKYNNGPSPGDGTVPLDSAIDTASNGYFYVKNADHAELIGDDQAVGDDQVIEMIKRLIGDNKSTSGLDRISTSKPSASTKSVNWEQWTPASPITLHLYDDQGNHTGETDESHLEKAIPSSTTFPAGSNYGVGVPADQNYTLKIKATGSGTFSLKKQGLNSDGEVLETIKFNDIPVNLDTVAEITDPKNPMINLDDDGDGNWDRSVEPALSFNGDDTPKTSATLNPVDPDGNNDWYKVSPTVSLSAQNLSGLGVSETNYRIDEQEEALYQEPFVVNEGQHKVGYYSVNDEGNPEMLNSKDVNVDITKPSTTLQTDSADDGSGLFIDPPLVTLSGNDLLSGLDKIYWRLDNSDWQEYTEPVLVAKGTHKFEYYSVDIAGNKEDINEKDFKVGADNEPPKTQIFVDGQSGQNGWYLSDVAVTLLATDNEGGSGVAKTEYSFDGGENWNQYFTPFTISAEAVSQILFKSTDVAGNIETANSREIKIDKTAPEAQIMFDTFIKDLIVLGSDNLTTVDTTYYMLQGKGNRLARNYTLNDEAGNQASLSIEVKNEGHEIKAELLSLGYKGEDVLLPESKFKYEWSVSKKDSSYNSLNQEIEIEDLSEANAHYIGSKDQTKIKLNKENTDINGMTVLKFITSKGTYNLSY